LAAAYPTSRSRRRDAGMDTLLNQCSLILSQCSKHLERQPSMGSAGIDVKARERLQANPPVRQVVRNLDQMLGVAPQPVELPDDEHIPWATGPQCCRKLGPCHTSTRRVLFVNVDAACLT